MIVVEGPDGTGKTTLVNRLAEEFDLGVGERGVADRDKLYEVTRPDTYRALASAIHGPAMIWDRLFISEFIYCDIQPRRPCEFSRFEKKFVLRVLDAIQCPVILCMCPYPIALENVGKDKQMEGVVEGYQKIYNRYARVQFPTPKNIIWYDYTGTLDDFATLDDVREEVQGYLELRKVREAWQPALLH